MNELKAAAEAALKAKHAWYRAWYELWRTIRVKGYFETMGGNQ